MTIEILQIPMFWKNSKSFYGGTNGPRKKTTVLGSPFIEELKYEV